MIGKNNKKLKELKQGVKVESYSIKKFKFGAASIVIGASIFFGTGVASANEVAASSDSSATNDTNATSGNGDKVPEKINTVSAEKESVASVNKPSSVKEESTKVEVEKKVVDKSLLETSITKLEELLATVNKDKAPASTLSAVNVDLINAKSILENANASQEEVDALVKKLKQQTQIVSSMPKVTTKEKEVKEGANTIANSGSRDLRNGKSMGEGTQFRANGQISSGALANIKYFASVDPNKNGGRRTRNNEPELTLNKTDIKAYYMEDSQGKWIVYDVFFNNDGHKMTENTYQQHYYFQAPFNIMDPSNTVKDLTFTRYRNTGGRRLSDGFQGFERYGNTATITNPWSQQYRIFNADRDTFYDPNSGVTRNNQRWDVFKYNQDDPTLNQLTKDKNGNYPGLSYYLGVDVRRESTDYAMHMHAKIKLKNNITEAEANAYGRAYAASVTKASGTSYSYIMGATGTRLQNDPDAPKDPIKGLTVTKTVGGDAGDPINPVSSGYVTHKNGKSFPAGMNWTWKDNKSPSTAEAGVFKYKSIATYKDGSSSEDKNSGSDGTVTLNVKPKQPIITPNLEHKKGLPNQQITVNVGNGVPNNSKVNIYDGDRIIGTGTTNGGTAIVTVKEALPGKPLKAETVVTNNNGTVTSDKSNPVTPTPKPDTQAPTLTVTPEEQVVKVGEKISFNVDGRDDTKVNLDFTDLATKYASHLFTQKTTYSVNTDKQKTLSIDLGAAKESDIGEKTITFKATDDANHEIVKTVKVKVIPATKENEKHNPTAETVVVGIKQELTDEAIKAKVKNYPSNATLTVKQKPDTDTTGNKTATVIVTYSDKSTDEVTVPVVVRDTTPPKIYWVKDDGSKVELGKTHAEGQNIVIPLYRGDEVNTRLITTDDSGKVTNFKMENLQSGFNFTPVSGTATEGSPLGQNVTGKVGLSVAKGKYTARAISTDGTNSTTGHFVFEVHEQAEKYTPAANTLTVPFNHKITDDEVKGKVIAKPGTPAFPNGTIFEVVSKPETNTTGTDKKAVVKITYPDKSTENIDVPVHVGKDLASQHPLEGQTVTVTVGDSLKTWRGRVDSNQYTNAPKGRGNGVEWGWKGTTPKVVQDTAGVFKYTATATHTDKSVAESNPQVTVIVKPKAPTIETDLTGKAELPNTAVVVNVHEGVKNGSIVTLYSQDGRAIGRGTVTNGKATITGTIPKGNITAKTTVQTPGEQDVTSDPSPEKVATTNKAGIYPIKGKTATVTVGDSLRQWNGRVDANQYTEAGPNGKGIGVEWGWEGTAPKILQDTAGVFKYTATATHTDKTVAKSDPKVTIIVKPKQPTIETDLTGKSNKENVPVTVSVGGGVKDGSIVTLYGPDGTTVIGTGTVTNGKATAIITGKVPVGNITAKTTVQTPGEDNVVSEPSPIKEATNIVPTAKTQTVGLNEQPNAKNSIGNNGDLPNGTNYTWKTIPDTSTSGDKPGVVTVTYPDGSTIDVPVTVKVTQVSDDYTPKYDDGKGKPGTKVEIPLKEENNKKIPDGTTFESDQPGVITVDDKGKVTVTIPKDKNPGDKITGKVTVKYPDGSKDEVPVKVTVTNRDKDDYTPKYEDGSGKPGTKVEIPLTEENKKDIPEKTKFQSDTPEIKVDDKGKVTVTIPKDKNPGDKVTGKITVTYPDGSTEEVPVTVTVTNRDKDDYTPKYEDGSGKPGTKVEIPLKEENGKDIPVNTTYVSDQPGVIDVDDKGKVTVTIPKDKNPGDKVTGKITVTYPDGSTEEVPVTVTVTNRDKDDYTPKYEDGSGKPGTKVEIPLKEENEKDIPVNTTYVSDQPGVIDVDDKGKVTVTIPKDKNPGDKVTGKITVTYPDGSTEEVPVTVTVTDRDKDVYTPKYEDGSGKPGTNVEIPLTEENKKDIPEKTKFESDTPEIKVDDKGKVTVTIPKDKNPGDKVTGKITVTYPDGSTEEVPVTVTVTDRDKDVYTPKYEDGNGKPGSKVEIPLTEENGKKIPDGTTFESDKPGVITVDKDGKVTVTIPEGAKPGDKITGKVKVRYPDGSTEEIPVTVTVGEQDKDIYTPKYEDGNGKPGSKVEIPLTEENGKKIPDGTTFESDKPGVITVGKDGKVTVTIPEGAKPGDKITGKVKVRYPDGSTEEIPVTVTVTTPGKVTPDTPTKPVEPTKQTKRLANTGTTETNTGLAGLGLGILGGLLAAARRRKNDKN